MSSVREPRPSRVGRRVLVRSLLLLLAYGLLELALLAAYAPLTGESFFAEAAAAESSAEAPDLRVGREQAGLGMRDTSMSLHPYLGYVFTPRSADDPGPLAISPDGFLDTAPPLRARSADRLIVAITGGSVAGQLGSWHSAALLEALRATLGDEREIDLVRLGMPGYHQPQQVQQLTWILAQGGELDVLVNIDGFNEVAVPAALNAPRGTHPLFPMNWSMVALDVPDLAVRRDIGAVEFLQEERLRRQEEHEASWRSCTVWGRVLWKLEDRRLADRAAEHAWRLAQFEPEEVPYFVAGPARDHEPPQGLVPFCVDVWKRSSLQLDALCAANGIRYVHFLQPNQYDPDSKPLSTEERSVAYEDESPYRAVVEEGYPLLRAAGRELAELGVQFVDLSPLFEGIEDTLYADNCCHYNALGNEILSAAIADALAL